MKEEITLDIEFGSADNKKNDNKMIGDKEKNTSYDDKESKREYIKTIIQKGLVECSENYDLTLTLKEKVSKFENCGFTEDIYEIFDYTLDVFGDYIPNILLGQYDDLMTSSLDKEDNIAALKSIRKKLINIFKEDK